MNEDPLARLTLAPPPPGLKARIFAEIRSARLWAWVGRLAAAAVPLIVAANVAIESSFDMGLPVQPARPPNPMVEELLQSLGEGEFCELRRRWEHQLRPDGPTRSEISTMLGEL